MQNNYYIGLDVGTNSVGWAVTDEDYNILRKKGKDLWGIRLFSDANPAAERRLKRSSRRRLFRRRQRIDILNALFEKEILKVDKEFFNRLKESSIYPTDKGYKFNVFNDKNYTDKDFSNDYPTLYHLRKDLILNNKKHDIRLIYLAIHSMFKHRGHFLFSESLDGDIRSFEEILGSIDELITENQLYIKIESNEELKNIFDEKLRRSELQSKLKEYFKIKKTNDKEFHFIKLITGSPVKMKNIFNNENERFKNEDIAVSLDNYEEKLSDLEFLLEDEEIKTITIAKEIYDWLLLKDIMNNKEYI